MWADSWRVLHATTALNSPLGELISTVLTANKGSEYIQRTTCISKRGGTKGVSRALAEKIKLNSNNKLINLHVVFCYLLS